jgi:hypothetical protein
MDANAIQRLPDANRLSVLAATFILAYGMTHFIVLPVRQFDIELLGFFISADIGIQTLISLLVAGLAATGSDWLLRDHPKITTQGAWPYAMLPALTAWVIGVPLGQLPYGLAWWLGLFTGSLTLILVVTAEYMAIDPEDVRHPLAAAGLSGVSYVLFLVLAVALRAVNTRLIFILPALAVASLLVCLRVLHLRLHGEWLFLEALFVSFLMVQFATGLHYWPLTPIQSGVLLVGLLYGLISLVGSIAEGKNARQAFLEPAIGLVVTVVAAVWLG